MFFPKIGTESQAAQVPISIPLQPTPSVDQLHKHSPSSLETPNALHLATDKILAECPRLRVLVVGKVRFFKEHKSRLDETAQSGAGKSSLISCIFGVKVTSVSHKERGRCDIKEEIFSSQNSCLVLHDSMGFEHGNAENFNDAKIFIEERSDKNRPMKERLHVVWLCIKIPTAGGRVFETGDEKLLEIAFEKDVPVVVVFTQYDVLFYSVFRRLPPSKGREELCKEQATRQFMDSCLKHLEPLYEKYPDLSYIRTSGLAGGAQSNLDPASLDELVQTTRRLVDKYFPGDAWIVSAMAQRASAQVNIEGSVAIGMKMYWRGLASSTNFSGHKLESCLNTVHNDMTASWNFYDPEDLLRSPDFVEKIRKLAQFVTPSTAEAKSWLDPLLGVATGLGPAAVVAVPAVAAIALSVTFVRFIAKGYHQTPETLRCFMGYIIDLTLILEQLFRVTLSKSSSPLTNEDIDKAFENYKNAGLGMVHRRIREFVAAESFAEIIKGSEAEERVKELIWEFSGLKDI
ncbi:G domain-containing protein [Mycena venus]|uniref:G domain-containing protein n=1 Tax=Mycena venus TaxID=2733690 RepID=A0A8H7DD85_9AGAR|nr:G domain-containing protein [Mycena venus]